MFYLSLIEHNLPVPPHLLNRPLLDAVKEELERLFLDKVISSLGLCISVYDIQSIEGGFIFPGDGSSTYKVVFRLVMFRPFVGEILGGRIEKSSADGLRLSLGFFNDIYVPVHLLQQPCKLGPGNIWIWQHECGELTLDLNEEVHFRVADIKYPSIPIEQKEDAEPFAPMEIIVSHASFNMPYLNNFCVTPYIISSTSTHSWLSDLDYGLVVGHSGHSLLIDERHFHL